jgi:hypothetical protein
LFRVVSVSRLNDYLRAKFLRSLYELVAIMLPALQLERVK